MKKILILMVLISTTMLSVKAYDDKPADQQISVKHLIGLEHSIAILRSEVQDIRNTDFSPEEGQIAAAQLIMIESEINAAEDLLMAIDGDTSLTLGNINNVRRKLKSARHLLTEI